jgi:hypothetical protein
MSSPTHSQSRFGTVISAEPKKTIALAVLLTVLSVMLARYLLSDGKPATARAASTAKSATSGKKVDIGSIGPRANPAAAAMQKWADAPVPPVSRNLFAVRMDYFPVDNSRTTKSDTSDEGFWTRLEKSLASQADQRSKHDNLKANFMAQASELKLQSIVMGPQPTAMVNGQLVGEGSVVAGFRVLKIEARRMIIEREGIRLEIQMK